MKLLLDILNLSADFLEQKDVPQPRRQAEELISQALGLKRLDLYLLHDKPVTESELAKCRELVQRRGSREPLGYILGSSSFYGCELKITPDVLIPRPETEILVDQICKALPHKGVLWDLCTGSGCIGIAIKKKRPELQVIGSDICPKALAIAKENAQSNGVNIELRLGDLLDPFKGQKADFIVCNPPYISSEEFENLEIEVKKEPQKALVAPENGLLFYQRLAHQLPEFLHPSARVWLEIGHKQGEAVKKIFNGAKWKSSQLQHDWAGHSRFFSLEFE